MGHLSEVKIFPMSIDRFRPVLGDEATDELLEQARTTAQAMQGRTMWNVNSTATGGGVAEMLQSMIAYGRGAGIDIRWLVMSGDGEFFSITKRLHNALHGNPGDGGALGVAQSAHYRSISDDNARELTSFVREGDFVLLHDPQTAGLVDICKAAGATVVWRCHIGRDDHNDIAETGWEFLQPFIENADAWVFSRRTYAPSWLDQDRTKIIPPSLDPFSAKNQEMSPETVRAILTHVGIINGGDGGAGGAVDHSSGDHLTFTRRDGTPGRVEHHADVIRAGHGPTADTPLVAQVSRWDRLKDMKGVMEGFAHFVDGTSGAQLALVGPYVSGVADDPEQVQVYEDCMALWRELPHAARSKIQLICIPMTDIEENAAIVNALQRHATVMIQKSLEEGFGLTVSEAMWKETPVVASAVGGIQDQINDGEDGILLTDPTDLGAFGSAVRRLLEDPQLAITMGRNAHDKVRREFTNPRHLLQYSELLLAFLDERGT